MISVWKPSCPPMLGPPPLLSSAPDGYYPQNAHPACKEEQLNQMMPGAPSCPDMQRCNSWPVFSRATSPGSCLFGSPTPLGTFRASCSHHQEGT